MLNLSKKGATDCSAASAQSIHRWPVVPFSLCRHQRAPIHPADRDEDEQEWTTGTRQRQGDPGLTFDLSPLLNPLTFHPTSCTSHFLFLPCWLLLMATLSEETQSPACYRQTHIKRCLRPTLFLLPLPLLLPLSPSGAVVPLPRRSQQGNFKKKRKIMKIHGRSCNIYSYKPIIVVESKRSFSPYTWQTDICVIQQMFKKHGKHFVSALSRSLFLSVLFWTLEEKLGGLGKLDHTGRRGRDACGSVWNRFGE